MNRLTRFSFQGFWQSVQSNKKSRQRFVAIACLVLLTSIAVLFLWLSVPVQQNLEGSFLMRTLGFHYVGSNKDLTLLPNLRDVKCIRMSGIDNSSIQQLGSAKPNFLLKEDSLLFLGKCDPLKESQSSRLNLVASRFLIPKDSKVFLDYSSNTQHQSIFVDLILPKKSKASLLISSFDSENIPFFVENVISNGKFTNLTLSPLKAPIKNYFLFNFPAVSVRFDLYRNAEYREDWFQSDVNVKDFSFTDTEQTLDEGRKLSQVISGSVQIDGKDSPITIAEDTEVVVEGGNINKLKSLVIDKEVDRDTKQEKKGLRVKLYGKSTRIRLGAQKPITVSRLDLLPDRLVSVLVSAIVGTIFGSTSALLTEGVKKWLE